MDDQLAQMIEEDEKIWQILVNRICETFSFSDKERSRIEKHPVVKTLGMLPLVAGCENPLQSGFINMLIYFGDRRGGKEFFLHQQKDDNSYETRLEPFRRNFRGGDSTIIDKGFAYLALVMLEDYHTDMEEDQKNQKYNPLISGAWEYQSLKEKLITMCKKIPSKRFDLLMALPFVLGGSPSWEDPVILWGK